QIEKKTRRLIKRRVICHHIVTNLPHNARETCLLRKPVGRTGFKDRQTGGLHRFQQLARQTRVNRCDPP
ncbi:MAG: hypothetical protein KDE04_23615, partial [Anaerolineales bacterium]|nr:hypothetical protein [Anaerolineales bacterium]